MWPQSHKVQKAGRLGIREPRGAREKAVLGAVPHAHNNPSSCSQDRDHPAHRVAHLPTHVFVIVESKHNRHQSNARIATSCIQPGHIGHVYPGSHNSEAARPEQRHSSSSGVYNSCGLRPAFLGCVPSLCLLETARSVRKHWLFHRVHSR